MSKILIISGHPDYKASYANRAILDEVHREIPSADIVYLDALYPTFKIDVEREQNRLRKAELVTFEFPFWWYGSPSLMHRYVEAVFTHGFAYGSTGKELHGKKFILSFTTGAPEEAYKPEGVQGYSMDAFMPPFLAMINLTGLDYRGAVISYGMALIEPDNQGMRDKIMAKALDHAQRLVKLINSSLPA